LCYFLFSSNGQTLNQKGLFSSKTEKEEEVRVHNAKVRGKIIFELLFIA